MGVFAGALQWGVFNWRELGACSLKRYDGCMPIRGRTRVRVIAIARLCTDEEETLEDEVRNIVPKVIWSSLKSYNKVK